MALAFYVTIEGSKQKFVGESTGERTANKIAGISFSYEVSSPCDLATGQASGKRQHTPVVFTKEWGASSPQIYQAAISNEVLKSVKFEFMKTSADGQEEVSDVITLTSATVNHFKRTVAEGTNHGEAGLVALDEIALMFQKIQFDNMGGKTTALDDWHR